MRIDKILGDKENLMLQLNCFPYFLFRGRNDFYQLGHGTDSDITTPKSIEVFEEFPVVDIAVGQQHCVAVSQNRDVYFWGSHDEDADSDSIKKIPTVVSKRNGTGSEALHVGIAAGPNQVCLGWHQTVPLIIICNYLIMTNHYQGLFNSDIFSFRRFVGRSARLVTWLRRLRFASTSVWKHLKSWIVCLKCVILSVQSKKATNSYFIRRIRFAFMR